MLWTCCPQHLSILFGKNSSQTLQWFSRQRRKSKLHYFGTRTNCSQNFAESEASVAWSLVIFHCASSFRGMWAFSRTRVECWELCQWSRNGSQSWKWGCTGKDHEIPCHSRCRVDGIVATVSFSANQNKTILTFPSGEKTIAAFDLNFCQIKSTNVGNNMSKAQSFRSIIVEMVCD